MGAFAQNDCDAHLADILPVAASMAKHSVEKRGFVNVPLDYEHPNTSPKIKIFYRLLPSKTSSISDTSKPILVIINGGPGSSSSHFLELGHDYSNSTGYAGRLQYLSKHYRVLLFDQRGTAGGSAPLDMQNPDLDPYFVAKYFNADSIAKDLGSVINKAIPKNERFFIVAQSFGGIVGALYMAETLKYKSFRVPSGIVFAASALPTSPKHSLEFNRERRQEQYNINMKLAEKIPAIKDRILHLRHRVAYLRPTSTFVDMLHNDLIGRLTGDWESKLNKKVRAYLSLSDKQLAQKIDSNTDNVFLLNYILSSTSLTPGYTDKNAAIIMMAEIPFEPWMIDECAHYANVRGNTPDQDRIIARIDSRVPKPLSAPSNAAIRKALEQTKVLFTTANDDAAVPMGGYIKAVEKIKPTTGKIVVLPNGGHSAVFESAGVQALIENGFK